MLRIDTKLRNIRQYSSDNQVEVVDVESMQRLFVVNKFMYYVQSERKILYCRSLGDGYEVGYYNRLTIEELLEKAGQFMKNMVG